MNASHEDSAPAHQTLPRVLGLFDAACMVVGSIIGSGVFLKVSKVDSALAPYGFLTIMGIWLFVGLVTLCGALALAELGAMFPQAGGPYLYLREAYQPVENPPPGLPRWNQVFALHNSTGILK